MQNYLISQGIPAEAIVVDNDGVDTYASAVNTQKILRARELRSVLVVTQYFHIARSKLALATVGLDPVYAVHARHFEPRDFYSTLREIAALAKYMFVGKPPAPGGG